MHFLALRKADEHTEAGQHPDEPWLGTVLRPSDAGVCVRFREGHATVTPIPRDGAERLVAGFSPIEAASKDEAVAIVQQWVAQAGAESVEVDVRETGCPGGLAGVAPLEPGAGLQRFAVLLKSEALERGFIPGPELLEPMAITNDAATRAGLMIAGDGLMPSMRGSRIVRARGGRIAVLDGPFAEAKELVAGYWIVQAATIDAVIAWVKVYPYPVRNNCDVEIRPVI